MSAFRLNAQHQQPEGAQLQLRMAANEQESLPVDELEDIVCLIKEGLLEDDDQLNEQIQEIVSEVDLDKTNHAGFKCSDCGKMCKSRRGLEIETRRYFFLRSNSFSLNYFKKFVVFFLFIVFNLLFLFFFIVLGDFNIHNSNWLSYSSNVTNPAGREAEAFAIVNDLTQVISEPTRVPDRAGDKANNLDLFLTSNPSIYSPPTVSSPLVTLIIVS